jgi:hypothetical protein
MEFFNQIISNKIIDNNDIVPNSSYIIYCQDTRTVKYFTRDCKYIGSNNIYYESEYNLREAVKRLDPKTKGKAKISTIKLFNSDKGKGISFDDKYGNSIVLNNNCRLDIDTIEDILNNFNYEQIDFNWIRDGNVRLIDNFDKKLYKKQHKKSICMIL